MQSFTEDEWKKEVTPVAVPLSEKREEDKEDEAILNDAKIDAIVSHWFESNKDSLQFTSLHEILVAFYNFYINIK